MINSIQSIQLSAKHSWFIMLLLTIFSCVVIFYPVLMSSSILYSSTEIDWPIIFNRSSSVLSSGGSSNRNSNYSTTCCRGRLPNTISLQNSQRIISSDVAEIQFPTSPARYFHPINIIRNSVLSIAKNYGSKLNWLLVSLKKLLTICLFWKSKCTIKKEATAQPSKPRNDHVDIDINTLSQLQRDVISETYESLRSNSSLVQLAEETNYSITHHLVYRYYAAVGWAALYNGKKYASQYIDVLLSLLNNVVNISYSTAIAETILWRKQFDVCKIDIKGDHNR